MTWPTDRWADLGGRRIRYWLVGEGSPTIVVVGGLGTTVADWAALLPELSRSGRTVVHDRAGLGASDPDPEARTAERMVDDLREVLRQADLAPPYLLVGHSWGGLVVRLLAHLHPEDVAGLVLVDATHEATIGRGAAVMNRVTYRVLEGLAAMGLLRPLLRRSSSYRGYGEQELAYVLSDLRAAARGARREAVAIPAGLAELAAAREVTPVLGCPVVVLSSGGLKPRRGPAAKVFDRLHELHRGLANEGGYHRVVPGAGHYVHLDQPEAVLDAVRHLAPVRDQSKPNDGGRTTTTAAAQRAKTGR